MRKAFFVLITLAIAMILVSSSYAKADEKWKDKLDDGLRKEIDSQNKGFSILSAPEKNMDVIVMTSDKNLERFGNVKKKFSIIQAVSMSVPASRLEQMARLESVEKISMNYRVSAFRIQAIPLIKADTASDLFAINGTNINISIVDTGLYNHTEFQNPNRIAQQKCFCTGCCQPNSVDSNSNATDDNGHGTHVAGIAAGKGNSSYGRGVGANSSLFAVKVLDNDGGGDIADIVSGIEWSVNNNAKIISLSLGTYSDSCSDIMVSAVDNAAQQGVLSVVAVGNCGLSGSSTCPKKGNGTIATPACSKNALTVGSVSDTSDAVSGFSSRGPTNDSRIKPDMTAPGSPIVSTVPPNSYCTGTPTEKSCSDNDYNSLQGTSMSTPFVSGAAALVMEKYNKTFGYFPEPERVKAILLASANTSGMEANGFANSGTPYRNNYYGSGRLDVYKALQIIRFTLNDTITQGQQKVFYFNTTNASSSIVLVWGENSTTYNNLDLIVGNGTNNFTAGADRNDTVEQIFLKGADTAISIIYVNGTSVSGSQKFYIAYTQDIVPPQWSANISNPSSPANYSKNGNYSFNITWTDDVAVDEVVFEWNSTNYSYKKSNITNYGSVFTANLTGLPVGNYSYRWFANDTSGKWNSTFLWNYSVARTVPNITILLNVSSGNFTIASGDFVNITTYGGEGNISLYRNGLLVNNSLPPIVNITNYTGIAGTVLNITAFYNQTQNFTSQTAASFIKIDSTPPVFSNNKTYPAYPAPYGSQQFNITVFDETNISSAILEWNFTTTYTVPAFSGSGSYNTAKEFYQNISNISVGNHTYRWFANDSMNNTNSSQNFSYSIIRAASLSRLFLNGTENNRTYTIGEFANITALLNISWKNISIFANFSGSPEIIASNNTSSAFNITNTSNLNASSVYNITSVFSGDGNYTASSITYYLGLCPVCSASSDWSSCSGGSQSRTVYSCGAPTNYLCQPYSETQACSSGSSSGGGGSIFVTTVTTAAIISSPINITSYDERIIVSISTIQANATEIINITDSLPIRKITISAAEKSTNAKIEIRNISTPAAQKPEGEVFQYLSIEKTNLSLKNSTEIEFFVAKKWVSDNGINVSTIILNRLSGNWTKLATAKTGEDSANIYFSSSVPGFSYFAITGEKVQQIEENTTGGKQANAGTENENLNMLLLVFVGIILLSSVSIIIYILKKRKLNVNKYEARQKK